MHIEPARAAEIPVGMIAGKKPDRRCPVFTRKEEQHLRNLKLRALIPQDFSRKSQHLSLLHGKMNVIAAQNQFVMFTCFGLTFKFYSEIFVTKLFNAGDLEESTDPFHLGQRIRKGLTTEHEAEQEGQDREKPKPIHFHHKPSHKS
jgi:hypothetical protein